MIPDYTEHKTLCIVGVSNQYSWKYFPKSSGLIRAIVARGGEFLIYMDIKYREYLISKKWEGYKNAIHYIYNDQCYICGSTKELHVHHKTYDRIYHEDLDDLILLCKYCHEKVHYDIEERNNGLKFFSKIPLLKRLYLREKRIFWKNEYDRKYIPSFTDLFNL